MVPYPGFFTIFDVQKGTRNHLTVGVQRTGLRAATPEELKFFT